MGPRPMGPRAAYASAECSPDGTAAPSAMTKPSCYSIPAGSAATKKTSRATPTAGQPTQDCGRQQARGQGVRGWSASHPGGAQGTTANVPSSTTPGATQSQPGGCARPKHPDPALLVAKFCSGGWRKDLEHVLNIQAPFREAEWVWVRELFFDCFIPKKDRALAIKEGSPLDYMPLIAEEFWRAMGLCLHGLPEFTLWIKRGSYYHGLLVEQDQI